MILFIRRDFEEIFQKIKNRYNDIISGLGPSLAYTISSAAPELRELSYMGATVYSNMTQSARYPFCAIFPVIRQKKIPIRIKNTNSPEDAGTTVIIMQKKIPIRIKNTNSPEDAGTLILADTDEPAENTVTGVAGRKGFSSINIEKYRIHDECGAVRKMLEVLEEHGVNFEHIPSGIDNFSIVVETTSLGDETDDIVYDIKKVTSASSVTVENGIALIAVVGRSMKSTRGVAGTIFSSLAKENINIKMIDQGSSEINIVIAVAERDYERTINTIYSAFVK